MNMFVRSSAFGIWLVVCAMAPGLRLQAQSAWDNFDPIANGPVRALAVQADGKILVGGSFTQICGGNATNLARLRVDSVLDASFNLPLGANNTIHVLAVQADGKILIGGDFTSVGGYTRTRIARLNADGTVDTTFNPTDGADNTVNALAVQADGKILVGGAFLTLAGVNRNRLGRLNSDGTVDTNFNPDANSDVLAVAVQDDGKILVGGAFTTLNGSTPAVRVGRLTTAGALDPTFNQTHGADGTVRSLVVQPDGKILVGGQFALLGGQARGRIGRLNKDGSLDPGFNPPGGADADVNTVALAPDGKIWVGGTFTNLGGVARNRIGRLNADGTSDATYVLTDSAGDAVYTLALQPDGKVLVGGEFHSLDIFLRDHIGRLYGTDGRAEIPLIGNPGANDAVEGLALQGDGQILAAGFFTEISGLTRHYIARLLANSGTNDAAFDPAADDKTRAVAVQPDGRILVGGEFHAVGGQPIAHFARLATNGQAEAGFNPAVDDRVDAVGIQPDGKILIGGMFHVVNTVTQEHLARLNLDGTLDIAFAPDVSHNVKTLVLQPDGKIVVGGEFTNISGRTCAYLGRVNADGMVDTTFATNGADDKVRAVALQADGKLLVGGDFLNLGGQARARIGRLNADGTLDETFINTSADTYLYSIAIQTDGKIWVGGGFTTLSGQPWRRLGRLNIDGTADTNLDFTAGATAWIYGLALQPDGKVVVGGLFTNLCGVTSWNRIGRLKIPEAAIQNLVVDNSATNIIWRRSAAGPELEWMQFQQSADGVNWTTLGTGTRISGGWQITGLNLPVNTNFYVRAQGLARGGIYDASLSLIQSVRLAYITPASHWVTADFDGDRLADPAEYIHTNWYIWMSGNGYNRSGPYSFGRVGGTPVGADFDGDQCADPAVYLGTNWYVWLSSQGYAPIGPVGFGLTNATPVAADFDGDRVADPAVYTAGNWFVWMSGNGYNLLGPVPFGLDGATPVGADFDGDRVADPAMYQTASWYIWLSSYGYLRGGPYPYGISAMNPLAGDFDGDGLADPTVCASGIWYTWLSGAGYLQVGPFTFTANGFSWLW